MSRNEIDSTMLILLLTGSGDTQAAPMLAATYFVILNPSIMARLKQEIWEAIGDDSSRITLSVVSKLEYLDAVIKEAMRMHAPIPTANPRIVNRPSVRICGVDVPQGARVGIPQKAAYRSSSNFVRPLDFLPDRWLDDPNGLFAGDSKDAFEPFLVGNRNCIGKSLGLAQVKLVLTKMFHNFEMSLSARNEGDWCDQRTYLINEKKPLRVSLQTAKISKAS